MSMDNTYSVEPTEFLFNFYRCLLCPYRIKSFEAMRAHMKRHHQSRESKSFACNSSYRFLKTYKCKNCRFKTALLLNYKNHLKIAHELMMSAFSGLKNYQCTNYKCRFITNSSLVYLAHSKKCKSAEINGNEIRWFPCKSCPFIARRKTILNGHVRVKHTPEQKHNYVRKNKGKQIKMKDKRQQQCNNVKNSTEKQLQIKDDTTEYDAQYSILYECDKCKLRTKFKDVLFNHKCDTIVDENLKCDKCFFVSKSLGGLKSHKGHLHKTQKTTHQHQSGSHNTTNLSISSIDNAISECSDLNKHFGVDVISKYSNLKNVDSFICELCTFRAKSREDLKKHIMKVHIAPLKMEIFQCDLCSYRIGERVALTQHIIKKHLKPIRILRFKCEICRYNTTEEELLENHILEHEKSGGSWLKCQLCSFKTTKLLNLKEHAFMRHIIGPKNIGLNVKIVI